MFCPQIRPGMIRRDGSCRIWASETWQAPRPRYPEGSSTSSAGAGERFTQSGFLGLVEGGTHDLTPHALQPFHYALGGHFPHQQEQRGFTALKALRDLLHEGVINADISKPP